MRRFRYQVLELLSHLPWCRHLAIVDEHWRKKKKTERFVIYSGNPPDEKGGFNSILPFYNGEHRMIDRINWARLSSPVFILHPLDYAGETTARREQLEVDVDREIGRVLRNSRHEPRVWKRLTKRFTRSI